MQVTSITLFEDGSYKTEEIQQKILAEMTPAGLKVMLLETHTVIWSPLQNVAFVDLEMEKELKGKGIKTFTKDGQEFTIVGLEKQEFVQLVKKICSLAKAVFAEKQSAKQSSDKKGDEKLGTPSLAAKTVKEKAEPTVNAPTSKMIISYQTRQFVYRVALAIIREIREQTKKKAKRDEETKAEYKRIDVLKIERKCREEAINSARVLTREVSKTIER